tara:strand:+ start:812 stop:1090 length:279 start_codon:yes stop_codon:yes gene_type:complete
MSDEEIIFKTDSKGQLLAWETPKNEAAQIQRDLSERIDFYITTQSLKVDDSIFIPNRETAKLILTAWDKFKVHLMVEENSYTIYNSSSLQRK